MTQPPAPGSGPGPQSASGVLGGQTGRALGLADLATGRARGSRAPGAEAGAGVGGPRGPGRARAVAALSGTEWRCPGATDAEVTGLLNGWPAVESWAAAG